MLEQAEAERALEVSVATFIDLWYVSQTTEAISTEQFAALKDRLVSSEAVTVEPVTVGVADATMDIPRTALADPWDRLIVATAIALRVPLVTRDSEIRSSGLVETIW